MTNAHDTLTATSAMVLERFPTDEIAALNNAMTGFGSCPQGNIAHKRQTYLRKRANVTDLGSIEEAREWMRGERTNWDSINPMYHPGEDGGLATVRCAQADAADVERAYWVLRAEKEGLL